MNIVRQATTSPMAL